MNEMKNKMYEYAKMYYKMHENLEVPARFKTNNGYDYDENGKINLGQWVANQRSNINSESEQGILLSQIGMRFEVKDFDSADHPFDASTIAAFSFDKPTRLLAASC